MVDNAHASKYSTISKKLGQRYYFFKWSIPVFDVCPIKYIKSEFLFQDLYCWAFYLQ